MSKRRITFKRILNYLLVNGTLKLKMKKVIGLPYSICIEPTNICNVKCPLCPTGNSSTKKVKGYMSLEDYKKIINELGNYVFTITLWNYGEPFLNPSIFEMIKLAKNKGIKVISSTNGYVFEKYGVKEGARLLVDSGLDVLVVGLDGVDQKTLSKYRVNAKFDLIVEGLKEVVRLKKERNIQKPYLELQFIVMKHNEDQVEGIKKLAKEAGVNMLILKTVNVFMAQGLPFEKCISYLPNDKKYRRFDSDGNLLERFDVKNGCNGLWFTTTINYDGNIVPCCYDPYEKMNLGNMFESNFKAVWNAQKAISLRKAVLKNKLGIPLCSKCPTNVKSCDIERLEFKESN